MSSAAHDHAHDHGHGHDDGEVHAHVAPVKLYLAIFGALIAFTILTVFLASFHLGPLNLAIAVIIASVKAALVVTFFMHLSHDRRFNALIFVCSLMFIGVFFAYTMNDTEHRGGLDPHSTARVSPVTGTEAPGGSVLPAAVAPEGEHHGEGGEGATHEGGEAHH